MKRIHHKKVYMCTYTMIIILQYVILCVHYFSLWFHGFAYTVCKMRCGECKACKSEDCKECSNCKQYIADLGGGGERQRGPSPPNPPPPPPHPSAQKYRIFQYCFNTKVIPGNRVAPQTNICHEIVYNS